MLWRLPLVVAIFFAIFWGTWYLVAGKVPVTTKLLLSDGITIQLPFAMSRIWDIVVTPLLVMLFVFLFVSDTVKSADKTEKRKYLDREIKLKDGPIMSAGIGAAIYLVITVFAGPFIGFGASAIYGTMVGLLFAIICLAIWTVVVYIIALGRFLRKIAMAIPNSHFIRLVLARASRDTIKTIRWLSGK